MQKELTHREEIRCTPQQKAKWKKAARLSGKKRADWIRDTLDDLADLTIGE